MFAATTTTIAEVLTGGPRRRRRGARQALSRGDGILAGRRPDRGPRGECRPIRAALKLKLPYALQVASAIGVNADPLVTHDRDFTRVKTLTVMS